MSNVDKNAEILLVNPTASGGTINLPLTTTLPYRTLTIKHIGSTSLNGITLATQGGDSFEDGTSSYVITSITTFVTFYANTSANRWVLVGGTNPFTQTISSLTVNTINGQPYLPISPNDLVSTSLLNTSLVSTVQGLGTLGYISTASGGGVTSIPLILSTGALLTSSLLASTISTTNTLFTNILVARSTNLSSVYISDLQAVKAYISSLSIDELILGTGDGWTDTGPLRATYISSLQENTGSLYTTNLFVGNTSTLNTIRFWGLVGNYNGTYLAEVSTGGAWGAQEFLVFRGSSTNDRIRFQTTGDIRFEPQVAAREFSTATALATPTMILQSNLVGIGTAAPGTTLDVAGTTRSLVVSTQQLFISSLNTIPFSNFISTSFFNSSLQSTVRGLGTAFAVSSLVASTISTTNTLFATALVARSTNMSSLYVSSLTGVTGYISSLTTDSLTIGDGNGWVDFGAARAIVFSSVQENTGSLYATTAYIGNTSTLNQIRYWGLFGNYNNTILAEVSTGSAVGAQEFLLFKGSSTSDRIRFQTTGDIRFEPQVSAREFSSATALATPTMILQSNLVGINNAAPATTLDVAGTIRGTLLSTLALNISSINGTVYSAGGGGITTGNLTSTVAGLGEIYLSTATGGGITPANLTSTVEGLGTANYISGPYIEATSIIALDTLAGINTSASTLKLLGLTDTYDDFPPWITSNQIAGSDPDPAPLRLDIFGSARILKNLYVGSTTTVLTTTGVQAQEISSFHTTASTITLSDKRPLFASTNTITSITDIFLNDSYVGQRIPAAPFIASTLGGNMLLQPEFLGYHFLLINSDPSFVQYLVRADTNFINSVPDGWYCYLKQLPDSNYFNDGVAVESDLGNMPLPTTNPSGGLSNFQAAMKFIISGGLRIPY